MASAFPETSVALYFMDQTRIFGCEIDVSQLAGRGHGNRITLVARAEADCEISVGFAATAVVASIFKSNASPVGASWM
jgi:hypothetical protein